MEEVSVLHEFLHRFWELYSTRCTHARPADLETTYLVMPVISCLLRADTIPLRLVEEMNDWLVGILDPLPFVTVELSLKVNHRTERCPPSEFWWDPSVPVGNGRDGTVKLDSVHSTREILGVGPVPKE